MTKVQKALQQIKAANSFEKLAQPLEKLNLNEKEKKQLANEIKKEPYAGHLKRLTNQAHKKYLSVSEANARKIESRYRKQTEQELRQKLHVANQLARNKVGRLRVQANAGRAASVPVPIRATNVVARTAQRPGSSSNPGAEITGISPQPAIVGANITITGENFNARSQQKVYLNLNDTVVEIPVDSWRDTRIVARIPDSVGRHVGEGVKSGEIYVSIQAYSHAIRVGPDPDTLSLNVSDLFPRTVSPGHNLVIEGNNLLTERRGSVTFRFNGRDISGTVQEWENTYALVTVPDDVEGLPVVTGTVKIKNHAGSEVTRSIAFEPALATRTMREIHFTQAIIFGTLRKFTDHDFHLLNGWTVKEYWLKVTEHGRIGGG